MKQYVEQEREGRREKTKSTKSSLDLITLIEGDFDDINDKVWDTTTELL